MGQLIRVDFERESDLRRCRREEWAFISETARQVLVLAENCDPEEIDDALNELYRDIYGVGEPPIPWAR